MAIENADADDYQEAYGISQSVDLSELDEIEDEGRRNPGNIQKQINTGDK